MWPHRVPVVLLAVLSTASVAPRATSAQEEAPTENLGDVRFETSCAAGVRPRFDRAVALLHHMTYARARGEFASIGSADPTCAMAYWGVAMTYFQPLWPTRPSEADLEAGRQAVSRAQAIEATTPRERMFVSSAAAFFDPSLSDYWERIGHWADATRALHDAYPDDVETRAFYALSLLATAPASADLSHQVAAAAVLDPILGVRPDHPGAVHYTIHANDAVGREGESLDVVRRYWKIAPRNPHALHMPTHIYVRLGEWSNVIEGNRQAAAAALESPVGERGQWVWDEFPHAIEYLVYALLQVGDDSAALREMTRLQATADLEPGFKTAFHLASVPARYALERHDWARAAELEPRPDPTLAWDRFPWPEAVTWFGRGLGAAHSGRVDAVRDAEARLVVLRDAAQRSGEDLFARQTEILRLGVSAWLAHAEADEDDAVRLMQQAASLEATTPKPPVTPAPTLPASELLGDLLLDLGRPEEALQAYRSTLASAPGRFNSVLGAARAARGMGDSELAARYYGELRQMTVADSPRQELTEASAFLARGY